jgi:hypothetical protein
MHIHSEHFSCIDNDVKTFFESNIDNFLDTKQCIDIVDMEDDEIVALLHPIEEHPIKVLTLLKNRSIDTSYPIVDSGFSYKLYLDDIDSTDIEAKLRCIYEDGTKITFFDTQYYKNSKKYEQKKSYDFVLNGFMYYCSFFDIEKFNSQREESEIELNSGVQITMPLEDGDSDDYKIVSKIESVESYDTIFDKKVYKIVVKLFSTIDVSLIVSSENLISEYIPKEGDIITGAIWLSGMMIEDKS